MLSKLYGFKSDADRMADILEIKFQKKAIQ